jgi:hypothetical protein
MGSKLTGESEFRVENALTSLLEDIDDATCMVPLSCTTPISVRLPMTSTSDHFVVPYFDVGDLDSADYDCRPHRLTLI